MISGNIDGQFEDYIKNNMTCLEDCISSCCKNCTDVACSSISDANSNPYQCLSEEEAQNWHKKCLPTSENYCQYNSKYFITKCYVTNLFSFESDSL